MFDDLPRDVFGNLPTDSLGNVPTNIPRDVWGQIDGSSILDWLFG